MSVLPTGAVTFLFTDIEGSTHALQQLGPAYADLLTTYTEVLSGAFAAAGGQGFGTEGDALFLLFSDPAAAVNAALDGQVVVAAQSWPGGTRVKVRMGVHTGEASLTPAGTYVGL